MAEKKQAGAAPDDSWIPPSARIETASLKNCIVWGNQAGSSLGDNDGDEIYIQPDPKTFIVTIDYCDVRGGLNGDYFGGNKCAIGTGVISQDPSFVNPASDFHLQGDSPCIDAGTDAGVYIDLDGRTRPVDIPYVNNNGDEPEFDMGAYEFLTIYVDDDADGLGDGSSWINAFNELYDALSAAHVGDRIFVAQGTYKPNIAYLIDPREAHFKMIIMIHDYHDHLS